LHRLQQARIAFGLINYIVIAISISVRSRVSSPPGTKLNATTQTDAKIKIMYRPIATGKVDPGVQRTNLSAIKGQIDMT
jgi:hypothetical protein